jgi:hypothetical protein
MVSDSNGKRVSFTGKTARRTLGLALLFAAFEVAMGQSASPHWWRFATPGGTAFDCAVAGSEDELESDLTQAGWSKDEGAPKVEWPTHRAVIIAPKEYFRFETMVLTEAKSTPEGYVISWTRTQTRQEGGPETIVVEIESAVAGKTSCAGPAEAQGTPPPSSPPPASNPTTPPVWLKSKGKVP